MIMDTMSAETKRLTKEISILRAVIEKVKGTLDIKKQETTRRVLRSGVARAAIEDGSRKKVSIRL